VVLVFDKPRDDSEELRAGRESASGGVQDRRSDLHLMSREEDHCRSDEGEEAVEANSYEVEYLPNVSVYIYA
jgi:hypothetical protein